MCIMLRPAYLSATYEYEYVSMNVGRGKKVEYGWVRMWDLTFLNTYVKYNAAMYASSHKNAV